MSWLESALNEEVQILSAARATDEYGQDVPDWDDVEVLDTLARVQPAAERAGAGETMVGRDQQVADARVWLAPGTPVTGRDRVVVAGDVYEVIGPPLRPRTIWTDQEHHVRLELRRVWGPGEEEE
jgi:head-tail adaptor